MPTRSWAIAPHATLRWVRADLRARRVQAILTVAVVAGVVAALLLAAMLLEGTTNPWQGLFARTHGADVMLRFGYGTDLAKLDALPGVTGVGTPSTIASATLEQGATESPVELRAMRPTEPAMSAPLVTEGRWLRAGDSPPTRGRPASPARSSRPRSRPPSTWASATGSRSSASTATPPRSPWSASPTPPTRTSTRRRPRA